MKQWIPMCEKLFKYLAICSVPVLISCSNKEHEKNILLQKGNAEMALGNYDEAIDFYNKAIAIDPDFADAYNNMGVVYYENGESGMALENYNKALRIKPDYYEAVLNRSNVYSELERFEAALNDIATLREVFPDTSIVYFAGGLIKTKSADYEGAIYDFKEAGKRDPANIEVPINLGAVFYHKGLHDSARFYLDKALNNYPDHGNALNILALMKMDEGEPQVALKLVNKALDAAPNDPYFINNRGFIYLQLDSLDRGEADINESIRIDPFNGWAYRNKAVLKLKRGQHEAAIGLLKRAIYEDSKVDLVYHYLGEAYLHSGNVAMACQAWTKSADRGEEEGKERLKQMCMDS